MTRRAGGGAVSVDALSLAQALVRCPSLTPDEAGSLAVLRACLEPLGCACREINVTQEGQSVHNFYARLDGGMPGPHLLFCGHVDVVPPGDDGDWSHPPFAATIDNGILFGRGACDMKGGIACFVAALARLRAAGEFAGSISLLITSDEEGPAVNGTDHALKVLHHDGERFDACLVGEPTNPDALGDMIKVGRRGSLSARLTVEGVQGHVAYPEHARNPIPPLLAFLHDLIQTPLDAGSEYFEPSHLEVTAIEGGLLATNVIPARAAARFNIRFNDSHEAASLAAWLRERCQTAFADHHRLEVSAGSAPFLSPPGRLCHLLSTAIHTVTGRTPRLGTTGGTSDARFVQAYCPVVEFGLVGRTMHQVDEQVAVKDIHSLTDIYARFLSDVVSGGLHEEAPTDKTGKQRQ